MGCNVGGADRWVRVVLGAVLLLAGLTGLGGTQPPVSYVLDVVGAVLLLTGLFRCCLLYKLFGINTAGKG